VVLDRVHFLELSHVGSTVAACLSLRPGNLAATGLLFLFLLCFMLRRHLGLVLGRLLAHLLHHLLGRGTQTEICNGSRLWVIDTEGESR
jgi:hypothetical protein